MLSGSETKVLILNWTLIFGNPWSCPWLTTKNHTFPNSTPVLRWMLTKEYINSCVRVKSESETVKTWSALKNLQSATLTPLVSNKGYVLSLDSLFLSYLHLGRKGIAAFWWVDHNILKNALLLSKMTIGMSMSVKQNLHAFSNLDAYLVKKRTISGYS